jgi:protein tyrosine/serine phosphatase
MEKNGRFGLVLWKRGAVLLLVSVLLVCFQTSSHAKSVSKEAFRGEKGVKPYTHLRFQNNPDNFQFAVMGDRTGGHRPGVLPAAVDLLNLLQPEFVVSVGDLIEGYSEDKAQLQSWWKEVDEELGRLDMPFFFVPGNHDINIGPSEKLWFERAGAARSYSHFIYKNVLFLLISTDDPPKKPTKELEDKYEQVKLGKVKPAEAMTIVEDLERWAGSVSISDAQVEYFKKVLEANTKVRWTFAFLHSPAWDQKDPANFKKIESLLTDRPYTIFAGHTHTYKYTNRNGRDYITMGTTGAMVPAHEATGNMDHLAWVTMTDKGPIIGNLLLNGIVDKRGAVPTLQDFLVYRPKQISLTGQSLGIKSVPNLRDLGGYKTGDGRIVAAGLVYRSNQLSGVSRDDMKMLANLKLKSAYDLRTEDERKKRPGELPREVNYVWLDVLADSPQAGPAQLEKLMEDPKAANAELGGGKVEEGFKESYREFVSLPSAKLEFRKLFVSLADPKQLPALFHCTTGKDRTGWAAASLLTLLGVPKDKVMEDYLRSNDYILPAYKKTIDDFVAAGGDPEIPKAILGVKKEYLEAAFDEMQKKYGTVEKYFSEGLGIDATKQDALKELYLGPGPKKQQAQGDSEEPKKKAVAK